MNLEQAVVFAILMENKDGILGKAPSYILEKLEGCQLEPDPQGLLDPNNLAKLGDWKDRWL